MDWMDQWILCRFDINKINYNTFHGFDWDEIEFLPFEKGQMEATLILLTFQGATQKGFQYK